MIEHIPVAMIRETMTHLPVFPLPAGYRIRTYQRGDESFWAEIETAAGEFRSVEGALAHFEKEYSNSLEELESRGFFLESKDGRAIGTATAWFNRECEDSDIGRLHWVGIHPDYQGRGLAKPLVGAAMERLAQSHNRAYLTTQTTSWIAVKVYLDFGFAPVPGTPRYEDAWPLLATLTGHPAISRAVSHE
jgi:GNAT superfamily N-acetyltransferase